MKNQILIKEITTKHGNIIAYCPECNPIELEWDDFDEYWYCTLCGFHAESPNQGEE
jgi:hypothetical protein